MTDFQVKFSTYIPPNFDPRSLFERAYPHAAPVGNDLQPGEKPSEWVARILANVARV